MSKQQRYSKEFQGRAVRRMKLGDNVSQLSLELGVHRTCLYKWKRQLGLRPQGRKRAVKEDRRESIYAEIRSRMRAQGGLSIQRMCDLSGLAVPVSIVMGKSGNRLRRRQSCAAPYSGWPWRIATMVIAASRCYCSGKG
jgi:transposase-like protein